MAHLLARLLRGESPLLLVLVLAWALLGALAAVGMLRLRPARRRMLLLQALAVGGVVAATCWSSLLAALAADFPRLDPSVPLDHAGVALAVAALGGTVAAAIHGLGRRCARNTLLAGSLLACAMSCMLFISMAGVVRPFALAYDLTAVLVVMVVGSALCGFGLWEVRNPARERRWYPPWLVGALLLTLAFALLPIASLAAILPFEAWIEAVDRPDDLASSPVGIIVAAESVAVLALTFSGSLLDTRAAARDRQDAERMRQLADSTFEAVVIHRDDEVLDGNERFCTLFGCGLEEARRLGLLRHVAPADREAVRRHLAEATTQQGRPLPALVLGPGGATLPVEILSRRIVYAGGLAQVSALRDVRERQAAEARIHFLAHHDLLTGLPNRFAFGEEMEAALVAAKRAGRMLAVLCVDLDRFKEVNDTLGHQAGDALLQQVAARLRECVRTGDTVARVGGDEFVLLQPDGEQPAAAQALATRVIHQLSAPFAIDGQPVGIGSSVGIALHPRHGEDPGTLLRQADIALYRAKEEGRGQFRLFEAHMDHDLRERRTLEADLREAIERGALDLHFQPIHACRGGALLGFEALARWNHPVRGPVSPAQFIPLAEASGLIVPLGDWVLRKACAAAAGWTQPCRVSINLSPAQFHGGTLARSVAQALDGSGLPAHRLELEVTEGVMIDGAGEALEVLGALRRQGTCIVLDDFGTGYSSLSYLHRFPFDKVKIDQSFVQKLEDDPGARAIISSIIVLGHALGLRITAEGVETDAQRSFLLAEGCDELQGYLLGRPIPLHGVQTLLGPEREETRSDDLLPCEISTFYKMDN